VRAKPANLELEMLHRSSRAVSDQATNGLLDADARIKNVVNVLQVQPSWPESWRFSHRFDELEIYGIRRNLGYSYAYRQRREQILDLIALVAKRGERIIDVAAAQGNFSIALAQAGYAVTWNDIRSDLVGYVKLKYSGPGIDYRPGNAFELNANESFDVALVSEVIEHVAHPDHFIAQIAHLVRPRGFLILTTPNGRYFRNRLPKFSDCTNFDESEARQFGPDAEDHIFLLHPQELRDIAEAAGLDVVRLSFFANPLSCGYLGTSAILRFIPSRVVDMIERMLRRLPTAISERIHTGMAIVLRKR
jgi:2-polyprenyl-3-methyl-5-hydroxy-6-metoxy-1,4-benzoquinol methylase